MIRIRSAKKSILKHRRVQVSRALAILALGVLGAGLLAPLDALGQAEQPAGGLPPAASFLTWLEVTDERMHPLRRISFRHERSGSGADSILYVIARRDGYADNETVETTWADGRTCPAIGEAMERLAALPTPDRTIPGIPVPRPSEFPPRVMDGNTYFISTYGEMPDRQLARMTVSSNAGPIAEWGRFVERELDPCWAPGLAR